MRRASRLGRLTSTTSTPACGQGSGQRGAERAGALDPDRTDLAVAAHPGQQRLVAVVGGRELPVAEQSALVVDRGRVVGVLVGVDATDHGDSLARLRRLSCWIRSSVRADLTDGANRPGGRQVCDGASSPSSYQVSSVWPVRAATLHRHRPTNRTQDTMVTPWPGSDRSQCSAEPSLHRPCRWSWGGRA